MLLQHRKSQRKHTPYKQTSSPECIRNELVIDDGKIYHSVCAFPPAAHCTTTTNTRHIPAGSGRTAGRKFITTQRRLVTIVLPSGAGAASE
ncbi:hypothetical protein ZHAS_00014081 [Anopheles sinensis]|uniref:Uncharacterized protein n=1 Tax=Anopheles sinensis TaxID=74873 RepID=A0A084W7A9_ANOSI|nr:hypothetical protein ZHAS_00014081 [Anopheles sinensis]